MSSSVVVEYDYVIGLDDLTGKMTSQFKWQLDF